MKTRLLRGIAASAITLSIAGTASAQSLSNLFNFTEETKVKGPFVEVGGQLYFAGEKGGASLFGYIGRFDRASRTVTPVFSFPAETKPKGGLTLTGDNAFLVIGDKGGSANFGTISRYDLVSGSWSVLHEFTTDIKPKMALQVLDGPGYYFTTDRGGADNAGIIARFEVGIGVTTVASLATNTGLKVDAPFTKLNGRWYYAAREGGDLTQASGKGAGAVGIFDPATGAITKLLTLHAMTHGAKIKSMVAAGTSWLYFTCEEGGDLSLNSGKGLGTICRLNVDTLSVERLCIFDGPVRGAKPKSLLPAGDQIYFVTGEGGANNYGVFGAITNSTNVVILGSGSVALGAKSEGSLTRAGNELLFTTELGGENYFGTIVAYGLPAAVEPARLTYEVTGGLLHISWPAVHAGCVLEWADQIDSTTWTPVKATSESSCAVPLEGSMRFFRLIRPQ